LKLRKTANITSKIKRIFFIFLFVLVVATTISLIAVFNYSEGDKSKPNIIIIVADALRKDHMGCYGYQRKTTPFIDKFAKESTLYTNAYAQAPSTKPSIASLFTSKFPSQHSVINNDQSLNKDYKTLAEALRDFGYVTAGFNENPMIEKRFQYNQGFDYWETNDKRHRFTTNSMKEYDKKIHQWIKDHYNDSFFLYLHYIDPHSPYLAPKGFLNTFYKKIKKKKNTKLFPEDIKSNKYDKTPEYYFSKNIYNNLDKMIAQYDEEIRYINFRFKKLFKKIKKLGLLEDTVIIFLSDHGEGFLEHGYLYHSYSIYGELVNIPLIIRYPRLFKPGKDKKYVQHVDIYPTILDILNIDTDHLKLEGKSILSGKFLDRKILSEYLRKNKGKSPQRGMIIDKWKLIKNINKKNYELYNSKTDILDKNNLLKSNIKELEKLKSKMNFWVKNILKDKKTSKKKKLDPKLKKKMKSLGYI